MSKCLKCGAALPPVGECPVCAATASTQPGSAVHGLLDKDIHIDRRKTPERTPAIPGPAAAPGAPVPSFADLARGPATPPGMTARSSPPPPPRPAMTPAQRLPAAPPPPTAQALAGDPDDTLPSNPPVSAVKPEAQAPGPAGDPDDTAPGQPAFAVAPPAETPSAMATTAQRAELPPAAEAVRPPPPPPVPSPGLRSVPTPVPVVTFAPPNRPAYSAYVPPPPPPPGSLQPDDPTPRPFAPPPSLLEARARTPSAPKPSTKDLEIHARPASLWRRLLSFTIDAAAIVGVATLYITLASSIAGVKAPSSQGLTALDSLAAWMHALKAVLVPGAVLLLVLATAYCAVAAFLWNGRTLGRLVLGLRLVDTHGVAPAPTRAILRAALSVLSFGLFLGGFWMALFDKRGQTLHDKLTSTFVVQPS